MKKILLTQVMATLLVLGVFNSCTKQTQDMEVPAQDEEQVLRSEADKCIADKNSNATAFEQQYGPTVNSSDAARHNNNLVQVAQSLPFFKSLVAAVVKTGLAPVLSTPNLNATVFAPTDAAFAKLPAPFNNAANITAITDAGQIAALKNILLYHVLGTEVRRNQIAQGRSSAVTLKPAVIADDNKVYLSKNFGALLINGNSLVLLANVNANNGIIHVIDDVLLPASQNIAQIAIGNPAFSSLVAALVKTNLAGVFTGAGNFTVFAPTNDAFAQLPAPFNNAANISAITNAAQIAALANILKYHVTDSRYFGWDLGIFNNITTIADAPNNKVIGILGLDNAYVKGNKNPSFATAHPTNVLATNGVVHVINKVLLP